MLPRHLCCESYEVCKRVGTWLGAAILLGRRGREDASMHEVPGTSEYMLYHLRVGELLLVQTVPYYVRTHQHTYSTVFTIPIWYNYTRTFSHGALHWSHVPWYQGLVRTLVVVLLHSRRRVGKIHGI